MQGRLGGACSLTGSFADSENANWEIKRESCVRAQASHYYPSPPPSSTDFTRSSQPPLTYAELSFVRSFVRLLVGSLVGSFVPGPSNFLPSSATRTTLWNNCAARYSRGWLFLRPPFILIHEKYHRFFFKPISKRKEGRKKKVEGTIGPGKEHRVLLNWPSSRIYRGCDGCGDSLFLSLARVYFGPAPEMRIQLRRGEREREGGREEEDR